MVSLLITQHFNADILALLFFNHLTVSLVTGSFLVNIPCMIDARVFSNTFDSDYRTIIAAVKSDN